MRHTFVISRPVELRDAAQIAALESLTDHLPSFDNAVRERVREALTDEEAEAMAKHLENRVREQQIVLDDFRKRNKTNDQNLEIASKH